jgi:hypothetical protein
LARYIKNIHPDILVLAILMGYDPNKNKDDVGIFPNITANKLVGIQPMTSKVGQIFTLKHHKNGLV